MSDKTESATREELDEWLEDAEGRNRQLIVAFKQLLNWHQSRRKAVDGIETPETDVGRAQIRGYLQSTDQSIEEIKRAAGQVGVNLEA